MRTSIGRYECEIGVKEVAPVEELLREHVYQSTESLTTINVRKLSKLVQYCDVAACYVDGNLVGGAVYRVTPFKTDITHMYVIPEYRNSTASRLLVHAVVNVAGNGRLAELTSYNVTGYASSVEKSKMPHHYVITNRTMEVANRLFGNLSWSM